jgi:hypothetical protein
MLRLALGVFALLPLVAPLSLAFAPAPLPRPSKGKEAGNEASVKKLREAIQQRRSETVTIVLAVGEEWQMPRLPPQGGKPRRVSISMDGGTGWLTMDGRKGERVFYGGNEGESTIQYTFNQGEDREKPFTVVVRFKFVKAKAR